jgi:MFS family permease
VTYAQLLRQNRDYRLLWGGQVVSQLGDWFNLITLQSLLLQLTGQASSVAGLMVAQMLPLVLLGPAAGIVVDRLPRKRVMVAADLARAFLALGFLLVRDPKTAWLAYAFLAGLSSLSVFFEPARLAITPAITRPEELVAANALSAVTWSILLTSGGLVGGIVTTYLGREVAFVMNSLSFLASALLIRGIRVPRREAALATDAATAAGGLRALRAGFEYVTGRPALRALLSAKGAWGLSGGVQVLIVLFGQQIFAPGPGKGALGISLLTAASGVGTAVGPILARRLAGEETRRMLWAIPIGYLVGGVFFLVLGHSWSLASAAAALFLGRMGGSAIWVFSTVLLQRASEDRFRGRVFAAEQSLATLAMALSGFVVGGAVDRGASPFAVATALGFVALVPGIAWSLGLSRAAAERRSPGADVVEWAEGTHDRAVNEPK